MLDFGIFLFGIGCKVIRRRSKSRQCNDVTGWNFVTVLNELKDTGEYSQWLRSNIEGSWSWSLMLCAYWHNYTMPWPWMFVYRLACIMYTVSNVMRAWEWDVNNESGFDVKPVVSAEKISSIRPLLGQKARKLLIVLSHTVLSPLRRPYQMVSTSKFQPVLV